MDLLYESGLQIARWLQATYPQLAPLLLLVSDLGRFEFYLVVVPLIYWCLNKSLGKEVAYLLGVSYVINVLAKQGFRLPRPYWLDGNLALSSEASYGIPSGHVQTATVIYLYLAARIKRRSFWVFAGFMISLMALSRVYLGVHFILDVVAGFLLGVLILVVFFVLQNQFHKQFGNRLLGQRLLAALLLPLIFLALFGLTSLLPAVPEDQLAWGSFIELAELVGGEEMASASGILLGLGVGFILEASRVHFVVQGTLRRRLLRYLLGMAITVVIWRGLGLLLPEDPIWLGLPLRLLRYWLAGIWVAYYAPHFFVRLGLADASPEPDVRLSISEGGIMRG